MKKITKKLKEKLTGDKDALSLLHDDHKRVQKLFREFKRLVEDEAVHEEKAAVVRKACAELIIHARIEEEIFYPAVRAVIGEDELLDEAQIEHDSAKELIHQLLDMMPGEELYDAKFIVLSEQVKHHIREEEDHIFTAAKKARMDLGLLGREMEVRKQELMTDLGVTDDTLGEINLTGAHAKAVLTQEGLLP